MGNTLVENVPVQTGIQSDIALWLTARDEEAAGRLRAGLLPRVMSIVHRYLRGSPDAEDLVQDIFAKVFLMLDRYRPDKPLEHWVATLATNICRDYLRRRQCRPELHWSDLTEGEQSVAEALLHEEEASPDSAADGRELLMKLLDAVSPLDRTILTLLHFKETPVEEIAVLLGQGQGWVKTRAFRARARMKKALVALESKKTIKS